MPGQPMTEAPCAVDRTGGYYPVASIANSPVAICGPIAAGATHFTYDPETGQIVDYLREVAIKSSRGRPFEDPELEGLYSPPLSVEGERAQNPGIGLFVQSVYEVIEQVAP